MDCETDEEFLCGEDEEYTYEEDPDYDDYQNDAEAGTKKDSEQMDLSSKDAPVEKNSQLMIPDGSYTVLNYADVRPILSAMVNEVSALLSVTLDEAELLLHFFQWDKEKITEDFLQDSDKCKLSAGLNLYSEEKLSCFLLPNSSKTVSSLPEKFQCRICYVEDLPLLSAGFSLGCGHAFCRNCYRSYLRNQIDEGPACVLAKCPEHKCQQSVTNLVFTSLLAEEQELVEKYERYVLQSFISRSKFMKYCPAPRCDKVAVGSGITTVRCTCSYPFCFRCGEEAHEPSSCAQLVEWMEKCLNESETANWILANTRKCPSCTTRIEKNQGCNHMSCKVCKHEFCWICMGECILN